MFKTNQKQFRPSDAIIETINDNNARLNRGFTARPVGRSVGQPVRGMPLQGRERSSAEDPEISAADRKYRTREVIYVLNSVLCSVSCFILASRTSLSAGYFINTNHSIDLHCRRVSLRIIWNMVFIVYLIFWPPQSSKRGKHVRFLHAKYSSIFRKNIVKILKM